MTKQPETAAASAVTFKAFLIERGIGPSKAADKSGVGRSSVWRWIHRGVAPRHEQAKAMATYLRVSTQSVIDMIAAGATALAAKKSAGATRARRARTSSRAES